MSTPVRVVLPAPLRQLARVGSEVVVTVPAAPATLGGVLDALEAAYPVLAGTVRDRETRQRRAFVRFFACAQDLSHAPSTTVLPEPVQAGDEPLLVIGAMAGG